MTFSCPSAATACASRRNRSRSAVGERIFSATVRSSVSSWARQTSDIGPCPCSSSSRERPAISSPGLTTTVFTTVASLLTLEQAQQRVLERAHPLPAQAVPIAEAGNRVTAEEVRAKINLPPFASSAMDGFAVRAADLPGTLRIVGEAAAGRPFEAQVDAGCAVAISTGAVVPEGADVVVPVENVVQQDNEVEIAGTAEPGAHIRPRGGDVAAGEAVVPVGVRLTPARLAAAAASGVAELACARRPRVAVLATGSELVDPGEALGPGQIYETNSLMLSSGLGAADAEVQAEPAVSDDEQALREALERGLAADVLVTSGGVSVGEHDLVRAAEGERGVEEVFWRVSIKPGKP